MKKLLLCRDCELKNDCNEYCKDALNFKVMKGNKKPKPKQYMEDKLIDEIIAFAEAGDSDPSIILQSKVDDRCKHNKKGLQN